MSKINTKIEWVVRPEEAIFPICPLCIYSLNIDNMTINKYVSYNFEKIDTKFILYILAIKT